MPSIAGFKAPVVPFLIPIGQERPEASSLCDWLSAVLAPMAPQEIRSATYCGEIGSKNYVPTGSPIEVMSLRIFLASIKPLFAS